MSNILKNTRSLRKLHFRREECCEKSSEEYDFFSLGAAMRWVALLGAAVLVRAQCPCCVPLSIEAEEACGNIDNA